MANHGRVNAFSKCADRAVTSILKMVCESTAAPARPPFCQNRRISVHTHASEYRLNHDKSKTAKDLTSRSHALRGNALRDAPRRRTRQRLHSWSGRRAQDARTRKVAVGGRFWNGFLPFQDTLMRCRASRGNDLRSNRRSSQTGSRQGPCHIGPYACVRNPTASDSACRRCEFRPPPAAILTRSVSEDSVRDPLGDRLAGASG